MSSVGRAQAGLRTSADHQAEQEGLQAQLGVLEREARGVASPTEIADRFILDTDPGSSLGVGAPLCSGPKRTLRLGVAQARSVPIRPANKRVIEEFRPLTLAALETMPKDRSKEKAWRVSNQANLSPAGRYRHVVMWRTTNLRRMFELLRRARSLLVRAPPALRSRKLRLDRSDWTQYHFFVLTTCFPAITDCCLLLAAETYQLGLPPRLCSFDLVTSHQWIGRSRVAKTLKALRRGLEAHTQRRHRYLHRGEEADFGELTDPEWLVNLRQITSAHVN